MTDADVVAVPDNTAEQIRQYCRQHPELIDDDYADRSEDPLSVLCYPASEAYYHANDCAFEVYCLSWSDVDPDADGTHWYLRDPDDECWIDLTLPLAPASDILPFAAGTHRGFITGDEPSKRAQTILDAIEVSV